MDLVPIFGIFMIIALVVGPVWITSYYRSKERQQLHETLRTAYEKGLPPPRG
jgi:type II secretory pathway pseudopilin PulG